MKHLVVILLFSMFNLAINAQTSSFYVRQAQSYQREAAYYLRQAESYQREADYYNRQTQNNLREAEYYVKQKNMTGRRYIKTEREIWQTKLWYILIKQSKQEIELLTIPKRPMLC